jgi:mannose-6-phosphate isomerase-like protein (cupin superfamily)
VAILVRSVDRPWGRFETFLVNGKVRSKLLFITGGHRLSYQSHERRGEFWRVLRGTVLATVDGQETLMHEGDRMEIPRRAKHRLAGKTDATVLELPVGPFDEADITRYEDDYGRSP